MPMNLNGYSCALFVTCVRFFVGGRVKVVNILIMFVNVRAGLNLVTGVLVWAGIGK
jgi:hypothetical protein